LGFQVKADPQSSQDSCLEFVAESNPCEEKPVIMGNSRQDFLRKLQVKKQEKKQY
jgi:hypothetical protein